MKIANSIMFVAIAVFAASSAIGQIDVPYPQPKQVAAPLPKLALKGSVAEVKKGIQYHKIILTVTNSDVYPDAMFALADSVKLPPNPCSGSRSRIVRAIYDNRGNTYSKCVPVSGKTALGEFTFYLEKSKTMPKFIYIVLTDLATGGAYRSNQVSPSSGELK